MEKVDKRSKEYKESVKVEQTKAPEIDRIFFSVDMPVILQGKVKRIKMLPHQSFDKLEWTDDGWLIVHSKGITKIAVGTIACIHYK